METEKLANNVDFSIIRYSNCWEDADLLMDAFKDQKEGKYLSICSAGDNSLSLLCLNPEIVVAVDLNDTQLYLAELKIEAIKAFDVEEFKQFIGIIDNSNRIETYQTILRPQLGLEAQLYWDHNIDAILKGVSKSGKFERYFRIFRKNILRFIHSEERISRLFQEKSEKEQQLFYAKKWNNIRWKIACKIFFSKRMMGKKGRDPEFLKQVNIPVGDYIFQKTKNHLSSKNCQRNFMLSYILTGKYGENLPHYVKTENYNLIKKNIGKLVLFKGYAQDAIEKYGSFDGMNLSDIFEYQTPEIFEKVSSELVKGLNKEGVICYWNLMVPRRISNINPYVEYQKEDSELAMQKDMGYFYSQFIIDKKG